MTTALQYEDPKQQQQQRGGYTTQFVMELINGFSLLVALTMVGVSVWGLVAWGDAPEGSWENVPNWAFYGALVFGGFVMFVSILGCIGARKRNKCALMVYIVVVFIGLVCMVAISAYTLTYYKNIGDAKDTKSWEKVDSTVQKYIVDGFTEFAQKQKSKWRDLQDYNECCGYNMAEAFKLDCDEDTLKVGQNLVVSTGKYCMVGNEYAGANRLGGAAGTFCAAVNAAGDDETALKAAYEVAETTFAGDETFHGFCQDKLLDATEKYAEGLGICAIVMVFSTLVALVAACRLACCVSSKEGGYSEEFGYGSKQQQQQTTGGALTGVAGVNYA